VTEPQFPDVRKKVTVDAAPQEAFRIYTELAIEWLPPAHTFLPEPQAIAMEPRAGGRFFERAADGSQVSRGTILEWLPPRRLVVTWRVGPDWRPIYDDEHASRIAVDFLPAAADRTEVVVTYSELERAGEMASNLRAALDAADPGETLERYAAVVARRAVR
jgi:uncharacterized protein YndB with AHSA1/START domain